MSPSDAWLRAGRLETARLILRPVSATDAPEAAVAFGDPALHEFTGGEPATFDALRDRYAALESQRSPDGAYAWLNWIARLRDSGRVVATVQATVDLQATAPFALLAWVTAADYQRHGIATEATSAVAEWLRTQNRVSGFQAHIHPDHVASRKIARRLGMLPQPDPLIDGEQLWSSLADSP